MKATCSFLEDAITAGLWWKRLSAQGAVVRMIKAQTGEVTLAIGDGANDCNMIQAADVGVGLRGEEGLQAFNVSHLFKSLLKAARKQAPALSTRSLLCWGIATAVLRLRTQQIQIPSTPAASTRALELPTHQSSRALHVLQKPRPRAANVLLRSVLALLRTEVLL